MPIEISTATYTASTSAKVKPTVTRRLLGKTLGEKARGVQLIDDFVALADQLGLQAAVALMIVDQCGQQRSTVEARNGAQVNGGIVIETLAAGVINRNEKAGQIDDRLIDGAALFGCGGLGRQLKGFKRGLQFGGGL